MPAENQQVTALGLPPYAREFIAAGTGVVAGLIAIFWQPELTQRGAIQSAGLLGVLCLLAGFVAANFVRWNEVGRERAVAAAFHIGMRVGLFAAVVATSAFVALATIHAVLADSSAEESALKLLAWRSLLAGLTSIIPGAAVGCIGAGLAVMFRLPSIPNLLPPPDPANDADPGFTASHRQIRFARLLSVLSVLGIMSPAILLFKPAVVDPPVVKVAPPPPPPAPVIPPLPPPWRYEPPSGLATASPLDFTIVARKPLPACAAGAPVSISPNGRWLAFCPADKPSVALMDLDHATVSRTYDVETIPLSISWSPDSRRLLTLNRPAEGKEQLSVLFAEESNFLLLPRPKEGDLPRGPIYWAREEEVVFFPDDEPFLSYDLKQLRLHPLAESASFTPVDTWTPEKQFILPATTSWQMELGACTLRVKLAPRRQPAVAPQISRIFCLAFTHPTTAVSRSFPQISLAPGVTIAPARDGSKVVRLAQSEGEIIYFGLQPSQASQYTVAMPAAKEDASANITVAKELEDFSLSAMVYAPMRNPLTQSIIGPDRERPLGYLRFSSWTGETANFWMTEQSALLSPDAVVADVHQWKDGAFTVSPLNADPFWWVPLGAGVKGVDIPPSAKPLITHLPLSIAARADRFITLGKQDDSPTPVVVDVPAFIVAHHKKATERDVEGSTEDYAEVVDYLGEPKTTRAQIRAKSTDYHEQWPIVSEEIVPPIDVVKDANGYVASYTTKWRTEREGEWRSGKNDLNLTLQHTPGQELRITRQTARVYDLESHKDAAVSPAPVEPPKQKGIRPDFKGKYTASSGKAGPVYTGRITNVLTIRQKTWSYSYHQRITVSATADAQSRRGMAGYVPDESTFIYSGAVIERSPTAIRVRIDSIKINDFKHAAHNIFNPHVRTKGDLWTFVLRGNGLAPQGQDHTFQLQETIDD